MDNLTSLPSPKILFKLEVGTCVRTFTVPTDDFLGDDYDTFESMTEGNKIVLRVFCT